MLEITNLERPSVRSGKMALLCDTALHRSLGRHSERCPLALICLPDSQTDLRQILENFLKAVPSASITYVDGSDLGEALWQTVIKLLPALKTST
jgi:hypothetical protein